MRPCPVLKNSSPDPWLISLVRMLRTTVRSSATVARLGNSSDMTMPDAPRGWNVYGDLMARACPVMNANFWPRVTSSGSDRPSHLSKAGFGSKVSICEGPPTIWRKITFLARAGW